jgi:hypothetical protein
MSFIDEVRAKRQKLADVLADEDYSGIREIVEELYPDRAHFIYELLQNAEDVGATEASFHLEEQSVGFEHNGRPFDEKDVWRITNIGKSTKKDQEDQIGRFGVGFKAVFAYSETPYIWSPGFSFKISNLVLPCEISPKPELGQLTRFEFPFNNPKKARPTAYAEIKAGLQELAETTLLFLSRLQTIRWQIGQTPPGAVLRTQHPNNHIEVLKRSGTKTVSSSHFLRISRPVQGLEKQSVSVAFPLDCLPNVTAFDPQTPLAKQLKIIPANSGRVAVSFPADKETSGLRFHLHAPFVPELSRASVKDTPANEPLFDQLAELAAASLHTIRDLGLLTAEFLATLPNPQDSLPTRYDPIREAIIEEMNTEPLTPTNSKSHAPARSLLQAKAALKDLLSPKDLEFLVAHNEEPPQWAIAASQKNSNADRFLSGLAITEWDTDKFIELLNLKSGSGPRHLGAPPWIVFGPDTDFMTWLGKKSSEWHQQMYALLYNDAHAKTDYWRAQSIEQFKQRLIVRLASGKHDLGPNCYFPTDGIDPDEMLPQVDKAVFSSGKSKAQQEDSRKFLEEIGVREIGEADQIKALLKKRYAADAFQPDHKDLNRFIALVEKDPSQAAIFADYFIFKRADNKWGTPAQAYLDSPFLETGLTAYYQPLGEKAPRAALSPEYAQDAKRLEKLVKFAEAVGAAKHLEIEETTCSGNPQWSHLVAVPGERYTSPVNRDWVIPRLEELLSKPSVELSRLIWRTMRHLPSYPSRLQARYQKNERNGSHYADSQLVHLLRSSRWVAQTNSTFVRPAEASPRLLPKGFPYDEGEEWLSRVNFGKQEQQQSEEHQQQETEAHDLGFADAEALDRARQFAALPLADQERILTQYRTGQATELSEHEPRNPERREERVGEEAAEAPERVTEERKRSVSVGREDVKQQAAEYLRAQYTSDGQMICQVCKAALPFKLDDGTYYFEKVEFLEELKKRHYQNYIALCPNHSAMFQHANASRAKLKDLFAGMEGQHLEVVLAQTSLTIYFTKTHIADLTKVIEVDAHPEAPPAAPAPQATPASAPPPVQAKTAPPPSQASHNPPPAAPPARPLPNGLVQCPHCPSPVRPDRLQDHIARVHSHTSPRTYSRPQPNRTPWRPTPRRSSSPEPNRPRTRRCACGRPAMPGDDYCYSCRP